MAKRESLYTMP